MAAFLEKISASGTLAWLTFKNPISVSLMSRPDKISPAGCWPGFKFSEKVGLTNLAETSSTSLSSRGAREGDAAICTRNYNSHCYALEGYFISYMGQIASLRSQ